ncbi:hypothetical protein EUGRSUZ_A01678 [Eucalyptus grandis]|uniref:Uncharacterized protein n=2 Tax=Eucalyptus grandis TaxID=71139 RepID=A0A059DFP6_EUCGR|nr:hypothetical protein EUGRSUZ_A01678 [Eucalyptus grandis]
MKDESHIVGREDCVNKLLLQLIDEGDGCANLTVISVFGEGAIGKTALVRSVCNRAEVKNHFDCCAWVRVGPKPNLVHLMVDLLKQLRVPKLRDVDSMDKEKLSEELLGVLMGCCYLIVLDDLCDLHLMDELMMVLADLRNGSRVIVTTRSPDIPLSIDPWNLLPLKETILSKSNGSPSKILLLGGLLSTTTLDGRTKLANGLPHRPTLQDVVHLGVNDLPEGLKQCALYLTLFPKESEIPTRRLFRLWLAENLVSSALENGAEECFEILVSRHMVEVARPKRDGSARSCRLPGSLYDVFYQMAENERFLKIYDCSIHDKKKFNALHIAIHRDIYGGGEASAQLGTRAGEIAVLLRPLVSKRDSSLLWILDLEGVYKPSLPEELGTILPNLKYLGLRRTLLERLPKSVGILSRLETLDMKYTNISDLPDSIWEAENLRHLYMTEVVLNVAIGHQLESKKSLNCNIQTIWGLVTHVNSPMLKVLHKLTGLRKLALTWRGPAASAATDNILNHFLNLKKLKSLRLRLANPSGEMGDMSRLKSLSNLYLNGFMGIRSLLESHIPPNLKVLTLSRSRLKEDPMGVLGKLKCLITLRLFAKSYDGLTLSVSKGTFPSLCALKLWKLEGLNNWTIQANAMTCLADLEIKDCKQLRTIDGLEQIKTLEVITLVRVPDELEQSVRDMQPNGPIIAKVLVIEFDTYASNK